jgi:hypothetical protein
MDKQILNELISKNSIYNCVCDTSAVDLDDISAMEIGKLINKIVSKKYSLGEHIMIVQLHGFSSGCEIYYVKDNNILECLDDNDFNTVANNFGEKTPLINVDTYGEGSCSEIKNLIK